jgi:2-polyprenyl-3-methyl-5-hydroxy-6-metoxy-1,4-benzoquinol methylase
MALFQTFPEVAKFLDGLPRAELAREISLSSGLCNEVVEDRLETYLNEVNVGFAVVKPHLSKDNRILEVGSGLGLLSALLAHLNYRIVSLEPGGHGFDFLGHARKAIERLGLAPVEESLAIEAEALDPSRHGMFDFIFSINVLEHIRDLEASLRGMASVLNRSGHMLHMCPNYAFPYEPHTGVLLFPFVPRFTRIVLPSRVVQSDIWQSLNFVTAGEVRRLARRANLQVTFYPGLLGDMFERMRDDRIFAARHAGPMIGIVRRAVTPAWLRRLPAWLASPMLFELRHRASE